MAHVQIFVDELGFSLLLAADILLKIANLVEIDGCRVFLCEIPELPVVDDLDFGGLVGAVGEAVDESGTVGGDVDT